MKININYTALSHYNKNNYSYWLWYFKKYTNIKGFIFRICGVYINCRENNATAKLIALANKK